MNKTELLNKIKELDGLSNDEKAYLVNLVNTKDPKTQITPPNFRLRFP
jgi:hypothetical protein